MKKIYSAQIPLKSYIEVWNFQERLRLARLQGKISDLILFVEHSPVITIGKQKDSSDDFFESRDFFHSKGVELVESNRGGRLTYHGPGQLVIYFVFNLEAQAKSIKFFVKDLEKAFIQVLNSFGLKGCLKEGSPGVWVNDKKIGFIGLHLSKGITNHGISFNLDGDLEIWNYILPCGIKGVEITSLSREYEGQVLKNLVQKRFLEAFENVWGVKVISLDYSETSLIAEKVGVSSSSPSC